MKKYNRKKISTAIAGINGYGKNYIPHLLNLSKDEKIRFIGAIEPFPVNRLTLNGLHDLNVPLYASLEEFYKNNFADLIILATPINCHCQQSLIAISKGSNVLCEKPLAATIQDAETMAGISEKGKKFLAVGYQWSFSDAIQNLKRDVMLGLFGRPKRLKSMVLWPRNLQYYTRNNWAGRKQSETGDWILDSPINNAAAHYLHNMFYILGNKIDSSALPINVVAEFYRANNIENFDTAALRCQTQSGVEILLYTSHAVPSYKGPIICYEFENAVVHYETNGYGENNPPIVAQANGKIIKNYGSPDIQPFKKLYDSVETAANDSKTICEARTALPQTLCINGAQDSMKDVIEFPSSLVSTQSVPEGNVRCVEGLTQVLSDCFEKNVLLSELGISWAQKGKLINLYNYQSYPQLQ